MEPNMKQSVNCPYCGNNQIVDFSGADCDSFTLDDDRQMGEEIEYDFEVSDVKCDACSETFIAKYMYTEYPEGVLNYEEAHGEELT